MIKAAFFPEVNCLKGTIVVTLEPIRQQLPTVTHLNSSHLTVKKTFL